ncbi:hypothetical protein M378DRAFT_164012 [Amanita muscaria Koide BX008]|uniref:Uncharacterized protein n=1 Tax=Amanita muscaria (strain Koide BX008) TaxID=946122 RepID=A0A0C2X3M6_AMAMK|nr:hypothetical protein M378DRAFT_164012 [Amanita muscaria Koide BX008]
MRHEESKLGKPTLTSTRTFSSGNELHGASATGLNRPSESLLFVPLHNDYPTTPTTGSPHFFVDADTKTRT